jgi:preprotein translocase subunit SecA
VEEQWDLPALERALGEEWARRCAVTSLVVADAEAIDDEIVERVQAAAKTALRRQGNAAGRRRDLHPVRARGAAAEHRQPLARTPAALDYLRQGIHLRGYAQKQPKQEYKRRPSNCSASGCLTA